MIQMLSWDGLAGGAPKVGRISSSWWGMWRKKGVPGRGSNVSKGREVWQDMDMSRNDGVLRAEEPQWESWPMTSKACEKMGISQGNRNPQSENSIRLRELGAHFINHKALYVINLQGSPSIFSNLQTSCSNSDPTFTLLLPAATVRW